MEKQTGKDLYREIWYRIFGQKETKSWLKL